MLRLTARGHPSGERPPGSGRHLLRLSTEWGVLHLTARCWTLVAAWATLWGVPISRRPRRTVGPSGVQRSPEATDGQ